MTLPLVVRNKSDFKEYPYQIGSARDLQFCYNFSNLPSALLVGGTGGTPAARVVYLADGTKVASLGSDAAGLVYRGSFVYRKTADGAQSVESVAHDEGRMLAVQGASGTEFIDTWHVRDYLGSVRAVYDITQEAEDVTDVASVILEQNNYYAFGGRIEDPTQPIDQENRYRFNGKEQLRFDGIGLDPNLTDYGARYYENSYARWTTPDPLADKYYSTSPYAFCNNNPVNFVDPDGMDIWEIDSNGFIEWIEKSNEHRLYSVNSEGKRSSSYITVKNRGILDAFAGKKNGAHFSSYSDINDMITVFKFAADNSNVEWAFHRGQDNMYTLGTSHLSSAVDSYLTMTGDERLPIASVHSHPNTTDLTTMGYSTETYSRSDQWKVNNNIAPKNNYVYFPKSKSLYLAGQYTPVYIRTIDSYQDFYFGILNHR